MATRRAARKTRMKGQRGGLYGSKTRINAERNAQRERAALACYRRVSGRDRPPTQPNQLQAGYMTRCGLRVQRNTMSRPRSPSNLNHAKNAWREAGEPPLLNSNTAGLGSMNPEAYYRAIAVQYLKSVGVEPRYNGNVRDQATNVYELVKSGTWKLGPTGKLLPPKKP